MKTLTAILALTAAPAFAQDLCTDPASMAQRLMDNAGEAVLMSLPGSVRSGVSGYFIFATADLSTWSLVESREVGRVCLVNIGEDLNFDPANLFARLGSF